MRKLSILTVAAAAMLAAMGCGGGGSSGPGGKTATDAAGNVIKTSSGATVSVAAANHFKEGIEALAKHDKARDWNEETCKQVAEIFIDAADEQKGDKAFNEAIYNAGVAHQRCKQDAKAKEYFQKALAADPKFHRARVQLALYSFAESGEKNLDQAIQELYQAAVVDARFQNVEGLVQLGMLHMKRNSTQPDKEGLTDLQRTKKYAQSALAIDDGYLPAFNLLALLYLESAKQKAGRTAKKVATNAGKEKKIDTQALDLAALVCSQAIRKNPNYAPIHNTAGMIQVELSNLNGAVGAFNTARKLDPTFYEAQMNFAAVNLQFRGFAQAEEAYRAALKMRPNDYDARLGLALALRGLIDDSNFDKMVAAASNELQEAKKIAPERPETYYNEAILTQEYKAKSGGKDSEQMLLAAKGLFGQFITKAGSGAEYADAVKRSKERMEEIQQIIDFNKQTEADRKIAEAEAKNRAAEAEAKGDEGGEGKPAEGGGAQ
ncbi:tetratricopeptide repeat protein [Polyangium aurulentum]|uniref:tetratricopeptide repeat protein n=1 Tax=Polyangium aurulentum TaxID=2567896 RepID=UPI001F368AFD|nr:tetratricopeptide repeat protein [Polyangium aurulentum]